MKFTASALVVLVLTAVLAAHPGHEYHVKGAISKVQGVQFEVQG